MLYQNCILAQLVLHCVECVSSDSSRCMLSVGPIDKTHHGQKEVKGGKEASISVPRHLHPCWDKIR